jgi:SAM-dependent MidA family methyltransferase
VIVGNEALDAMPCKLLARKSGAWHERFVVHSGETYEWLDQPTDLRPPLELAGGHDYLTEIHPEAEAFIESLAERMLASKGAVALFIDYGFGEREYYHPQRHMGTLMCHQAHRSDANPLVNVGEKDITTHVNFTGIAVAAQNAGLDVIGYTSQGRFLLNCGLLQVLKDATLPERAQAQKLVTEHEMGELFKVIALCTPNLTEALVDAIGFQTGDRTHTL